MLHGVQKLQILGPPKLWTPNIGDDYLYNHTRIKENNLFVSTGLAR